MPPTIRDDGRGTRIPLLVDTLRDQPLPSSALLERLNRALAAVGAAEITLRTLQHDLDWLRTHFGEDVVESVPRSQLESPPPASLAGHRRFYRLGSTEDLIPVVEPVAAITELEALALVTARAQMSAPPAPGGDPRDADEGPLATALGRLIARLGLGEPGRLPDLLGVNRSSPEPYEPEHVLTCLRALRIGLALAFAYRSASGADRERVVMPVRLVLNDGEPYLWAWDPEESKPKTYKLSRFRSARTDDRRIDVPAGTASEVKALIRDSFRAYVDEGERCRVTVRVDASAAAYVERRRFGRSQTVEELPDGGVRVSFNTSGKAAVLRWLLEFGGSAEVESPEDLREAVRAEVARMAERYAEAPGDAGKAGEGPKAKPT